MNQIVSLIDNPIEMKKTEGEVVEPVFLVANQSIDSLSVIANHLAHQITKNNNDLRSHTQRIYLFIKHQQSTAIYSALVDLFLVLGINGLALRKRILGNARASLSDLEFNALGRSLFSGLTTEIGLPRANLALLIKGLGGSHQQFIHRNDKGISAFTNASDEARSHIENGQLEQAQLVLQQAIVDYPQQLNLHYDLLEILEKMADKDQFSSTYKQLLEHSIVLPPQWQEMAQKFGVEIKSV